MNSLRIRRFHSRRFLPASVFLFAALLVLFSPSLLLGASEGAGELRLSPSLKELEVFAEHARTYRTMLIIFQIAALLIGAKMLGWLCERIKVPGVIGELLAGVLVGPFLLGNIIKVPLHGSWISLFPRPTDASQWPVNDVVWSIAQFGSVILMFVTGLHTDLKQFLRYVGPATLIATAGLLAPFALGAAVVYIPFFSDLARHAPGGSVLIPALFVGAILGATSIGITARVLSDINKLDTSEGVTIIGAAVVDDVLGIVALAIVGGLASAGSFSPAEAAIIGFKAFGFWIGLTVLILLLARYIEKWLLGIKYAGATVGLGLALAFICSGAAEGFGLAFIIGAYSVGLGLSRVEVAHRLMDEMRSISDFLVPIFFATLGMLVDLHAVLADWRIVVFGLVITAAAIIGKLIGCGATALMTGFNTRGAYRIGLGMIPRGEVALIVAGIGLSRHIIQQSVFSVSIMMTLLTTIIAPILLVPAFRGGSGRRKSAEPQSKLPQVTEHPGVEILVPRDLGRVLVNRLLEHARQAGWAVTLDGAADDLYLMRNGDDAVLVSLADDKLLINASDQRQQQFHDVLQRVKESLVAQIEGVKEKELTTPDVESAGRSA